MADNYVINPRNILSVTPGFMDYAKGLDIHIF